MSDYRKEKPFLFSLLLLLSLFLTREATALDVWRMAEPVKFEQFESETFPAKEVGHTIPFFGTNLKSDSVEVIRLKGESSLRDIFRDKTNQFVLRASLRQAFGARDFVGTADRSKRKVALDANAVHFTGKTIVDFVQKNQKVAVVVLADEGEKDDSISLKRGRIYHSGFSGGAIHWDPPEGEGFHAALDAKIRELREKGIEILYYSGDAVENTNGMVVKEAFQGPTDSWSAAALWNDPEGSDPRLTTHDNARIGGITGYNEKEVDLHPLDLPSVAIQKIAESRGFKGSIDDLSDEFRNYVNSLRIVVLGARGKDLSKERKGVGSSDARHAQIINDVIELRKIFPDLDLQTPGDGDMVPRIVSLLGLHLDGRETIVFGRSGSTETVMVRMVAKILKGARSFTRFVSRLGTDKAFYADLSSAIDTNANNYSAFEIEQYFRRLGYPVGAEFETLKAEDTPGEGVLALTAVTGATTKMFGPTFSALMEGVTYDNNKNRARANTLLITKKGDVVVVRTTFTSRDLRKARDEIKNASDDGAEFWRETAERTRQEIAAKTGGDTQARLTLEAA